jgi:hypothetical protein
VALVDGERRRDHDVVAALAVYRAAHRIDHQPARHRFALHGLVYLEVGRERLLGAAVGDELDAEEEPAAPDIPDVRVRARRASRASRNASPCRATFSRSFSSRTTRWTASAAAQAMGCPR